MQQLVRLHVLSHIHARDEGDSFLLHNLPLSVHNPLFQLHIRNAVHQQTSDAIGTLEDSDGMSASVQLIRHRKSGGSASHNGYALACPYLGRIRDGISLLIGILDNGMLVLLRRNRITVQTAGTCSLAERRTYSGGKLREIVGLFQPVICLLPVTGVDKVIPLGNQVMQRTATCHPADCHARLAERNAAFHTPRTLKLLLFLRQIFMKFIEMLNTLLRLLCSADFSLIFHKTGRFSHLSVLLFSIFAIAPD